MGALLEVQVLPQADHSGRSETQLHEGEPTVWRELDEWLRHRLRAIQLKQWKRGTTIFREATQGVARRVAANSRSWWRNSGKLLNSVLTIDYYDRLGVPRLS